MNNMAGATNNAKIPVIIGMVGGDDEWSSLDPILKEFRATFEEALPIKVICADASGAVKLFDAATPQKSTILPVSLFEHHTPAQGAATYLLRNSHFVLLAATSEKENPVCASIKEFAIEFPAVIPNVENDNLSVFELPQPAPVLAQLKRHSLDLEIVGREASPDTGNGKRFELGLFEYKEHVSAWKFWIGLKQELDSKYQGASNEKPFTFVKGAKDEMGRRWLDSVEAMHRQAAFNDEKWSTEKIDDNQLGRIGIKSLEAAPNDQNSCDVKDAFLAYCKADSLAFAYQTQWQKLRFTTTRDLAKRSGYPGRFFSFMWLGGISAFLLVWSTEFGGLFGGWSQILTSLGYVLILLISFVLYRKARKASFEQKHQDYRFVAEVLAIQLHWMLCGIKRYASNHFPSGLKSDVLWVRRAVHTCRYLSKVENNKPPKSADEVLADWITKENAQLDYHKETLQERREAALKRLNKSRSLAGRAFIGLFLIFAIFTLYEGCGLWSESHKAVHESHSQIAETERLERQETANQKHAVEHPRAAHAESAVEAAEPKASTSQVEQTEEGEAELWKERLEQFHHALIVAMGTALVLFALLGEVAEGYGLEQELTRSEALVEVYERCVREFKHTSSEIKKRKLLMDVGEYAINAEANWLVIHRERPIQPVKGG